MKAAERPSVSRKGSKKRVRQWLGSNRVSSSSVPPARNPLDIHSHYHKYFRANMGSMFASFVLAACCSAFAFAAYFHDRAWNHMLKNHKLVILTPAAQSHMEVIFGKGWKYNLYRNSPGLLFFAIFMGLSALGYVFHVAIYQIDLMFYRTTGNAYIHMLGLVLDSAAFIFMMGSIIGEATRTDAVNTMIAEHFNGKSTRLSLASPLLVKPDSSYFHFCPIMGWVISDEDVQEEINEMKICQDAASKITALILLFFNMMIYVAVIFISLSWKKALKEHGFRNRTEPLGEYEGDVGADFQSNTDIVERPVQAENTNDSEVQEPLIIIKGGPPRTNEAFTDKRPHLIVIGGPARLSDASNPQTSPIIEESGQPKLAYLTQGLVEPEDPAVDEPPRPEIVHVPRSSATRLKTMADKIRDGNV